MIFENEPLIIWLMKSYLNMGLFLGGNLVVIFLLGHAMFGTWQSFFVSIMFVFKGNFFSAMDGELGEDIEKSSNFLFFLLLVIGLIFSVGYLINQAMGGSTLGSA